MSRAQVWGWYMTCPECGQIVRLTRYVLGREVPEPAHHCVVPTPLSEPVLSEDRARSGAPRPTTAGAAEGR